MAILGRAKPARLEANNHHPAVPVDGLRDWRDTVWVKSVGGGFVVRNIYRRMLKGQHHRLHSSTRVRFPWPQMVLDQIWEKGFTRAGNLTDTTPTVPCWAVFKTFLSDKRVRKKHKDKGG
ncbi:hypothetical protein L204_104758 [Cryptococcus depauperatus]